jgi:hypothetical protein
MTRRTISLSTPRCQPSEQPGLILGREMVSLVPTSARSVVESGSQEGRSTRRSVPAPLVSWSLPQATAYVPVNREHNRACR